MGFLDKLYSNELFAPILFTVIAVLAVLFIIVLILAMKDAKKRKGVNQNGSTTDAFNQVETPAAPVEVAPVAPVQEINNAETEVKEQNVISSVTPVGNSFENVNVEAPTTSEVQVEATPSPVEVAPVAPVQEVVAPVEAPVNNEVKFESVEAPIQTENSAVASVEEVKKAENDLDEIAATLLAEYQKETPETETPAAPVQETATPSVGVQGAADQFSSVFVTPNTLPNTEEAAKPADIPSLNDIPAPQPVRVVNQSTVIDSSKQNDVNVNNIEPESYNLNK